MKLKFERYNKGTDRSLDILVESKNKEELLEVTDYIEEEIEEVEFLKETLDYDEDLDIYNIIGVAEFHFGSMLEIKKEIKEVYKNVKKREEFNIN